MSMLTPVRAGRPEPASPAGRRRDLFVVLVWLAVIVGGLVTGAGIFDRLSSAVDPAPGSESQEARRDLQALTGEGDRVVAAVDAPVETADALAARLRAVPGVGSVRTSAAPTADGILLTVGLRAGMPDGQVNTTVDSVRRELATLPEGSVSAGGFPVLDREVGLTAKADLARAELVALPIVLIMLGLAARSAVGALLGLGMAATTTTGALATLFALSALTDVSSFAVNAVTMCGIGLAVDYGLLVIVRFRRESRRHAALADAVRATMATTGRVVGLSGLTVALALAGLLVFAEPVVRSIAYGGIGAVGVAVLSAVTLLPVLLRRFGHRIPPAKDTTRSGGAFGGLARVVQRRPRLVAIASLGLLAVLAAPVQALTPQGIDARTLPADSTTRRDAQRLEQRLPPQALASIVVVASVDATDPALPGYLDRLRSLDDVTAAPVRPGIPGHLTVVDVAVDGPAGGADAIRTVDDIRSLDTGFEVRVTGHTARFTDFVDGISARLPFAAAVIALLTFAVLLTITGGVLVATKAVVMNLASLAASLGALVWIFQQGHLASALGFAAAGGLSIVIVVLTAAFAFGLSTDYEVFLLSAVMAARREGADTDDAVAAGIQHTGRVITTAAALIVVVFGGFATSDVLFVKQLGVGLAIAIVLDATLIRLALTPALMTMLGRHNWSGPAWARRTSDRLWRHSL